MAITLNLANRRVLASAVVGIAVGSALGVKSTWQIAVLAGWCTGALTFLTQLTRLLWRCTPDQTKRIATDEDVTHVVADATLLTAAGASLVAVGFGLLKASQYHGATRAAMAAIGALSVALAWMTIQTIFMLRYARIYYEYDAGIDFGGDDPDYHDFAYLAFTIGMTYQVSDTAITRRPLRRTVLRHSILSFLFATAFIAVVINVVGGLL